MNPFPRSTQMNSVGTAMFIHIIYNSRKKKENINGQKVVISVTNAEYNEQGRNRWELNTHTAQNNNNNNK